MSGKEAQFSNVSADATRNIRL